MDSLTSSAAAVGAAAAAAAPVVDLDKVIVWISHAKAIHPHDMTWFSTNFIYFIIIYVMAAKVLETVVFPRTIPRYRDYSIREIRNLVTYVLEVIVMSLCFYLTAQHGLKVYMEKHNHYDLEMSRLSFVLLCALYLFELAYRLEMNFQLTFHHIITLLVTCGGMQGAYATRDSKFVTGGVLLSLTATTEQLPFIALFMYRIKHKYAGFALRSAAIQTFLFKSFFTYLLVDDASRVMFGAHALNPNGTIWYEYSKIMIYIMVPGLFITQVYGAWVMWKLGSSKRLCDSPRKDCKEDEVKHDGQHAKHLKHA